MQERCEKPTFFQLLLKNVATLWFIGYLPFAPGTWGTLAGLVFIVLVNPPIVLQFWIIAAGLVIGIISSDAAEKIIGETDSRHIIIDEFVGFLISVFSIRRTYGYLIAAFLLFRIFDILKPFPIRKLEKTVKGGAGIMADDVLAGIFVNIILQVWIRTF